MTTLFGRRQGVLLGAAGAVAAVCAALLPVAPRMGFALQSDACDAFGACQTAELMTDSCTADTRSGAGGQAATPVYFEEIVPGRAALRYFADGTASVVADESGGMRAHRFPASTDALRWLVGRNPAESAAVDRAWGPAAQGQTDAVLAGAEQLGLGPRTEAADTSAVVRTTAREESAVLTAAADGSYTVHQTMTLPWRPSARLTGMLRWMGQQSHLVVSTEHTATGAPVSVTLTAPARADWDLRVLTGTQPKAELSRAEAPETDAFRLRSYTLDLTRQQNAQAFLDAFPTRYGEQGRTFPAPPAEQYPAAAEAGEGDETGEGEGTGEGAGEGAGDGARAAEVHPVDALAARILADAVLVETAYEGSDAQAQELTPDLLLALQAGLPVEDGAHAFAPRLVEAQAMDLARPESALAPIVNCEVLDEDDLQQIVDTVDPDGDD